MYRRKGFDRFAKINFYGGVGVIYNLAEVPLDSRYWRHETVV